MSHNASEQNAERFIVDCAIDDHDIMEKFLAIDQRSADYVPDKRSKERAEQLEKKIESAGLTGSKALRAIDFARAVNREAEYKDWYQVYSKLTHASAWAILGGSQHALSWDAMARLLLHQANAYAAASLTRLVGHVSPGDKNAEGES